MKHIIPNIPYIDQRALPDGDRKCFTASAGMLLQYVKPSVGINTYDQVRGNFGDTIYASSHIQALASLGVDPVYTESMTVAKAKSLITKGIPLGVGWLHHGSVDHPIGGGHWSVIYGYDETGWYVRDPMGDPDLVGGGWLARNNGSYIPGLSLKYSYRNFDPRWQVEGDGTGYTLYIEPK